MYQLILDHSALIPCSDKPEEERKAIEELGNLLPEVEAVWLTTRNYLRVLNTQGGRCWEKYREDHHLLPRLQSSLTRTLSELIKASRSESWLCKPRPLTRSGDERIRLKIHILRSGDLDRALGSLRSWLSGYNLARDNLTDEDLELLAMAVKAVGGGGGQVLFVTLDRRLIEIIEGLKSGGLLGRNLLLLRPSGALRLLQGAPSG